MHVYFIPYRRMRTKLILTQTPVYCRRKIKAKKMGATKSVPVLGETVTALDMSGKVLMALATAPFSTKTAEKFMDSAADSLKDYTERSPVAATGISLGHLARGATEEAGKAWSKVGDSCLELVDGLPVAGHAKGLYHYARGDNEHGDQCMKKKKKKKKQHQEIWLLVP